MPASSSSPRRVSTSLLQAFWYTDTHGSARVVGQGLVEYALILVLIAIVSIGALTMVGNRTSEIFDEVNCSLGGGELRTDNGNQNSTRCVGDRPGNGNNQGNPPGKNK